MTELWSLADISRFAKFSRSKIYEIVYYPGFPKPIRFPGSRTPRWDADEVKDWMNAQKEAA